MDDSKLLQISNEIDNLLFKIAFENEISALSLAAVVMARITIMCDEMECREDMNNLMGIIAKTVRTENATLQ
jgi:hypothetical protein